jgi:DNA polymerase delta subunit 3
MPDAPAATDSQTEAITTAAADTPEPTEEEPTVTVSNGRRRGRRRVMKKKKVKDEDGYLVTKEEVVWESFSEDEPVPKKLKPAPAKPVSSAKGKNAGKKGQGSIASFFKKA